MAAHFFFAQTGIFLTRIGLSDTHICVRGCACGCRSAARGVRGASGTPFWFDVAGIYPHNSANQIVLVTLNWA